MNLNRLAGGFAAATLALASTASAEGERDACLEAVARGQELRDDGKLIESRAAFQLCASSTCPTAVASFCVKGLEEVEHRLPTAVFRLRDESGADVSDATVSVDGRLVMESLTGTSIPFNPGSHEIRIERHGTVVAERTIVMNSGEKDRLIEATMPARAVVPIAPATKTPVHSENSPRHGLVLSTPSLLGFGVGIGALAATLILASDASAQATHLHSTCAPRCSQADVDAAQRSLTAANLTLVTAVVSVAFGAVWLVLDNARRSNR